MATTLYEGDESPESSRSLEEALAEWLERVEQGHIPDDASFLGRFPQLASVLEAHLDDWRKVRAFTNLFQVERSLRGSTPRALDLTIGIRSETNARNEWPTIPDFEVVGELGRGGMGIIYKARQISLDRWIAVKMMRSLDRADGMDVIRFQTEMAVVAQLDQPHIVPIYQVGEQDGRPYFVMKWIDGLSLAEHVREHGGAKSDSQRQVAQWLVVIARAIHHAHQRGILHRDLKPSNVLLDSAGQPHVTDFGLAKRLHSDAGTTQTGEFVGTPSYMAPEQATGKKDTVTTATDVYGLGAVFYTLLTGIPPFQGGTVLETLEMVREREPVRPRSVNRLIDRNLETICLKCLEKAPQRRYPTAEALAEDLERWLDGVPINAVSTTRMERCLRWMRRRPALVGLIGVSVAALLALIIGLLLYNHDIGQALADAETLRKAGLKRERELRRHLYAADMQAARLHVDAGEDRQALELLLRHVPESDDEQDLRGFEWHQMHALCSYQPRVLGQHDAPALCLAASPDSRWLATGDKKGIIKIWDLAVNKECCTLSGPARELCALAFSPDSKRLAAVANQDWQVRIWEVESWKPRDSLHGFFCTARGLVFSPDGSRLAACLTDGTTRIWNPKDVVPKTLQAKGTVNSLDWSPDGKQILTTGSDGSVKIWDADKERTAFDLPVVSTGTVLASAFHPNNVWAATAGYTRYVMLWDLKTRLEMGRHATRGATRALKFSPDGSALAAVGDDGEIALLHLPSEGRGQRICRSFRDGDANVRGVAYLHQGRTLATCAENGAVKLWDVARFTGVETRQMPHHMFALSAQARFVAGWTIGQFTNIHDGRDGKQVARFRDDIHPEVIPVFSRSDKRVAFVATKGDVVHWDFQSTQPPLRLAGFSAPVSGLAFSPNEETLAVSERDGTLRLWSVRSGQVVSVLAEGQKKTNVHEHLLRFTPDGKELIAAPAVGYEIAIWDVANRTQRSLRSSENELHSLAVSHDGSLLAGGVGSRLIQIWDLKTGEPRAPLVGNQKRVLALAFAPDGNTLASACDSGPIRLWYLPTGHPLCILHHCRLRPRQLAFGDQGRTLAAVTNSPAEAELLIWKLP